MHGQALLQPTTTEKKEREMESVCARFSVETGPRKKNIEGPTENNADSSEGATAEGESEHDYDARARFNSVHVSSSSVIHAVHEFRIGGRLLHHRWCSTSQNVNQWP